MRIAAVGACIALTCAVLIGLLHSPDGAARAEIGSPLAGLRPAELARFRAGHALFDRIFTPAEGLGPLFNENQCSACHTLPASGGTGEQVVVKATRWDGPGTCDLLAGEGGENIRVQATPALRAHGVERAPVPPGATATGRYTVPFLFGLGVVEAIPEETILAREDPQDADGDGISGRAGRDAAGRLARFGRKADHATLRAFTVSALRLEMGLTTPAAPAEAIPAGVALPAGGDPAPDPEIDARTVALLTDYVRFLAAPARTPPADAAEREMVERGEALFHAIGCASCHVPAMRTGRSEVPALDRKRIHLYSDLLLHDMGPGLADVCGRTAAPAELRTELLMGLGRRAALLHDGRARSIPEAIRRHGGEAARARAAFEALGRVRQEDLLRFLSSL